MKKLIVSSILILLFPYVYSQMYPFDSIPDSLKRRADAVIRTEQCLLELKTSGGAVEKYRRAITLLNDNSRSYRFLTVHYDKDTRINYLRGTIYDEKGKIIKTLGMINSYDMSAIPGGTFYSDDRMKVLYFPLYRYPYTIEYEYEISHSDILGLPTWEFQSSPEVSVESSGIQFVVPKSINLRHFETNLEHEVDSVSTGDETIYTWQEQNMPAKPVRNYIVETDYSFPVLNTALLDFKYNGMKGSMASWQKLGEWFYDLNKGRDVLPDDEVKRIRDLIAGTVNRRDQAKKIYEYMQARTRYVSIQIGIGGFQPADAMTVSKNGYGDCKALVNYTQALLKAANIKSYYTLVQSSGQDDINTSFVDDYFNHIILCVPMEKDTVWLECTNQQIPFNYLAASTRNRHVLMLTPEGGKLVKTPAFTENENRIDRTGSFDLYVQGNSSGKLTSKYSGYYFGAAFSKFEMQSEDEMKRYLASNLRYEDVSVSSVSYEESKSETPFSKLKYEISVNSFAKMAGDELYFNPSLDRGKFIIDYPSALTVSEFQVSNDSIVYVLPLGYEVEYLPKEVAIKNEFGEFRYSLEAEGDRIIYVRFTDLKKAEIPVEKFSDFRTFINTMAKTDRQMVILKKKSV